MATVSPLQDEHRHPRHFPTAELKVRLSPGCLRYRHGETMLAAGFTQEEVTILAPRNLCIGQKFLVDVALYLDRSEIHQRRLVAVVTSMRAEGGHHRYGLKARPQMPEAGISGSSQLMT